MKLRQFFQYSMWLPLLVYSGFYYMPVQAKLPEYINLLMVFGSGSFIPYLLLLATFYWWIISRQKSSVGPTLWWLPLLFSFLCMFMTSLRLVIQWGHELGWFALDLIYKDGIMALVLGYAYVVVIHAIVFMLRSTGTLKP